MNHAYDLFLLVPSLFPLYSYLSDGVGYLLHCLKREKERPAAFRAMGQMVYVLKDRMDLEPVLNTIKANLPTGKEVVSKYVRLVCSH